MTEKEIKLVVQETIRELMKNGILKALNKTAYNEADLVLKSYYDSGEMDERITAILKGLESDYYYKIIPLYYSYKYTNEELAEYFNVEVTTISRNKKRLCLAVYEALQ